MYKMFIGKVVMLILSVVAGFSLTGIALCVALGHILDMHRDTIKRYFIVKEGYQKSTECLIFLTAYYATRFRLNYKKAAQTLINTTIIKQASQKQNITDLFLYYAEVYIPKQEKSDKKRIVLEKEVTNAMKTLNTMENKMRCFRLIETIFNAQIVNPTQEVINLLKSVGAIFSVDYQREYKQQYNYENKEEKTKEKTNQQRQSSSKPKQEYKSSYISQEIKNAFKALGFNVETPPTLVKLKSEYRKQVRKYHPDILKGQQATAKKLAQAEKKLVELNKSMDIAKNFLANN